MPSKYMDSTNLNNDSFQWNTLYVNITLIGFKEIYCHVNIERAEVIFMTGHQKSSQIVLQLLSSYLKIEWLLKMTCQWNFISRCNQSPKLVEQSPAFSQPFFLLLLLAFFSFSFPSSRFTENGQITLLRLIQSVFDSSFLSHMALKTLTVTHVLRPQDSSLHRFYNSRLKKYTQMQNRKRKFADFIAHDGCYTTHIWILKTVLKHFSQDTLTQKMLQVESHSFFL